MKGSLVDKVPGLATMLYIGGTFSGFYATNQEAWLSLVPAEEPPDYFSRVVDIVTVISLGDGEIDIANVQTFKFEPTHGIYNAFTRSEDGLAWVKEEVAKNWKEAVTE